MSQAPHHSESTESAAPGGPQRSRNDPALILRMTATALKLT
jgi:hypothetical protein